MTYAVPADIAYVTVAGQEPCEVSMAAVESENWENLRVFLLRFPDGNPMVLVGIGAAIWLLAAEGSTEVATNVARAVAKPVSEIAPTVDSYLGSLVDQGFLRRSGQGE